MMPVRIEHRNDQALLLAYGRTAKYVCPLLFDQRWAVAPDETARSNARLLPPHLFSDIDRKLKLGPLFFLGQQIALFGGSKTALRRFRELVQRRQFARLLQPPLDNGRNRIAVARELIERPDLLTPTATIFKFFFFQQVDFE